MRRGVALVVFAACTVACGSDSDDRSDTTTSRPGSFESEKVAEFVGTVDRLPVAPAAEDVDPTAPEQGFDCDALAEQLAPTAGNPVALLTAAEDTEDDEAVELISAAQINVADGLASCEAGDHGRAADFFAAARAAVELLEAER